MGQPDRKIENIRRQSTKPPPPPPPELIPEPTEDPSREEADKPEETPE